MRAKKANGQIFRKTRRLSYNTTHKKIEVTSINNVGNYGNYQLLYA